MGSEMKTCILLNTQDGICMNCTELEIRLLRIQLEVSYGSGDKTSTQIMPILTAPLCPPPSSTMHSCGGRLISTHQSPAQPPLEYPEAI